MANSGRRNRAIEMLEASLAPKAPKILEASLATKAPATMEPAASGVRRGAAHDTGKHFGGKGNKTDIQNACATVVHMHAQEP